MSTRNTEVAQIRHHVHTAIDELTHFIDGPLTSLPPIKLYQSPAPNEWSLMENLAHIVEFLPYWADEIATLVATPNQNFGRTMQHEGRLRAIQDHHHDTLAHVKATLPSSYAHLDHTLASLTDHDLTLTGHHSKFGQQTLAWFIQEFVTNHLDHHLEQLKLCLTAVSR